MARGRAMATHPLISETFTVYRCRLEGYEVWNRTLRSSNRKHALLIGVGFSDRRGMARNPNRVAMPGREKCELTAPRDHLLSPRSFAIAVRIVAPFLASGTAFR